MFTSATDHPVAVPHPGTTIFHLNIPGTLRSRKLTTIVNNSGNKPAWVDSQPLWTGSCSTVHSLDRIAFALCFSLVKQLMVCDMVIGSCWMDCM